MYILYNCFDSYSTLLCMVIILVATCVLVNNAKRCHNRVNRLELVHTDILLQANN